MFHLCKAARLPALTLVAMVMAGSLGFAAETYPTKPIQVIIPFAAGGSSDLTGRALEKVWRKYSPQPMLVVNKPGAGGVLGTEYVVRSKPDGYTVYLGYGSGHDLVMPHLMKMPYDPFRDLAPVARVTIHAVVVCVSGKSSFNSMKDLLDWANRGNTVTAAVSTAAGANDIVMRAIAKKTGVKITTVPFAGGSESTTALAGGHLIMGAGTLSEQMTHVKAGRLKPLAVALQQRDAVLPKVPTLREQGIDVATWGSIKGVAVPAGTPPEIIEYLSSTLKKVCEDKEFKKAMASVYQPIEYMDTKEWAAFIPKAYKDYGDLIKELDIKI
jgi:tripartite-type tricarboxylate transporter receptor subunit TctC